jgi:hypothetical protein
VSAGGAESDPIEVALEWAEHLRCTRTRVVEALGRHRCTLAEIVSQRHRPDVGAIHLGTVLASMPGARRIDVRRGLAELGIGARTPLRDLDGAEVSSVLQEFGQRAPLDG